MNGKEMKNGGQKRERKTETGHDRKKYRKRKEHRHERKKRRNYGRKSLDKIE